MNQPDKVANPARGQLKAVVNTVGGLLASKRVFCWLPLFFFVPIRQIQTKADSYGNEKLIRKWIKSVFFFFFSIL